MSSIYSYDADNKLCRGERSGTIQGRDALSETSRRWIASAPPRNDGDVVQGVGGPDVMTRAVRDHGYRDHHWYNRIIDAVVIHQR